MEWRILFRTEGKNTYTMSLWGKNRKEVVEKTKKILQGGCLILKTWLATPKEKHLCMSIN